MTDVLIIGAGTAGLTAAIYTERSGRHAVVLESLYPGGQIVNTPEIENYPGIRKTSGYEFAEELKKQAESFGAEIHTETVRHLTNADGIKTVETASGHVFEARALILATGARNRHLGLPGEETFTGKGVSYCATCDGGFFRGKNVAVNGGGNTALDDALYLSNLCGHVTLIHRRDEFRGEPGKVQQLKKKENVSFILNSVVSSLKGRDRLEGIEVRNQKTKETSEVSVSALFVAIGQVPDCRFAENLVELDEKGYIVAGENCRTRVPGIFAAGDCRTKDLRQLTTAAADGSIAGTEACRYLEELS